MNAFSLGLVRKHFPQLRQPLAPAPWTVLIEHSDAESEAHAAARSRRCSRDALERGADRRRRGRRPASSRRSAMWHLRESIPLRAEPRPGRTSSTTSPLPVSAIADFVASTDARAGARLSRHPPGRLRPSRRRQPALQRAGAAGQRRRRVPRARRARHQRARLRRGDAPAAARSRPSTASALLKREELAARKSPVALDMMRAIKRRSTRRRAEPGARAARPAATP